MIQKILHTPDGVRDVTGTEWEQKNKLEQMLMDQLMLYGFRGIETPTFEFFDIFGSDIGTIPSAELYKFFDRDGNTLVLRPDFTPPIARAASRYFSETNLPVRLCYLGNAFVNHSSYRGRLKETTQLGAELIGDKSAMADAEVIAMGVSLLKKSGLKEFQLTLGNVRFFDALVQAAKLDTETAAELSSLIRNKNSYGAEKLLDSCDIPEEIRRLLVSLPSLFGGEEILEKALSMTSVPEAREALERLSTVLSILHDYDAEEYISVDLGMMSNYMYYTGIIFRAYTYGTGEALIKGGRYDHLLGHFGKDAASIGFVLVLDQLMSALRRQGMSLPEVSSRTLVLSREKDREAAIRTAEQHRVQGTPVVLLFTDEEGMHRSCADWLKDSECEKLIRIGEDAAECWSTENGGETCDT